MLPKKNHDETWRDYTIRCAKTVGLSEFEVGPHFDAAIASGDTEEQAFNHALYEWDIA